MVPLASHGMLPAGDTVTVAPGMAALYALDMASRVTGLAACLIVALTRFSTSATGRRGREFPASLSGLAVGLSAVVTKAGASVAAKRPGHHCAGRAGALVVADYMSGAS